MEGLQHKLNYLFKNPALLRQALTHRSHGHQNNERLEFLGDSVLNCVVSQLLFEKFGKIDEGDLSRLRANLVKQQSLYEIAQRLDLSGSLLLGDGELKSGGFRRPSILGDTLEAVIGAIFLDGGFASAQAVISTLYGPVLKTVDPKTLGKDAKTLLQEHLQGRKISLPVYSVVATHGAAHNQLFEVECSIQKLDVQVLGSGGSRRAAEQAAAKLALERCLALVPVPVRRSRTKSAETAANQLKPVAVTAIDMPAIDPSATDLLAIDISAIDRPAIGISAIGIAVPGSDSRAESKSPPDPESESDLNKSGSDEVMNGSERATERRTRVVASSP
jgi:ribonuclease III